MLELELMSHRKEIVRIVEIRTKEQGNQCNEEMDLPNTGIPRGELGMGADGLPALQPTPLDSLPSPFRGLLVF